jgi:hypothetical protein
LFPDQDELDESVHPKEVGILLIQKNGEEFFEPEDARLDLWKLERAKEDPPWSTEPRPGILDHNTDRFGAVHNAVKTGGVIVYKQGITTGLTCGRLAQVIPLHANGAPSNTEEAHCLMYNETPPQS